MALMISPPRAVPTPGILFAVPWRPRSFIGGVDHVVIDLLDQINRNGRYRSYVLVSGGPADGPPVPKLDTEPFYLPFRDPVWPTNRIRSLVAFVVTLPWTWWRLRSIVREHSIRMVICEFPEDTCCLVVTLLKRLRLFRGQVILRLHGADIFAANHSRGLKRFLYRLMYRTADWVVACSSGLRDDVLRLDPRLERRAIVIRHGFHIDDFRAAAAGYELPEALRGRRFLLTIGRYEHKKGHDVLIAAFERIAGRFPDLLLVLVGAAGTGSEVVEKRVAESPVNSRILMFESLPNASMPVFLDAALIFVLASRREGFPVVLLEAGACGRPVVATAAIGNVDTIRDGETGRLVPVDDANALADAIADLIDRPETRERLAANLLHSVREEFTWQRAYEQFIRLDEPGPPAA
jgi:glycosyltransferase involved in cell wall biosynthesis